MLNDALTVALLNEALNASTQARRIAARLLLDLLRPKLTAPDLERRLERVEATETLEIADQLRALIDEHGLRGSDCP